MCLLQTAGLKDSSSHCVKILSSMYAALNSDPSDPDALVKLGISHDFNTLCSSLHSGIEFGRSRTCEGSSGGMKRGVVSGVGQERLGPSYFFIPLVLGHAVGLCWP
jgi:hypothetical protein